MSDYKNKRRSVSQVKEYEKCPFAFKLGRIDREFQKPAAWLSMGIAVHEALEALHRDGLDEDQAVKVYHQAYETQTERLWRDAPHEDLWFASGPYKANADIPRRKQIGEDQIRQYINKWLPKHPDEKIWTTPAGDLALELKFQFETDGVEVLGFIDSIIECPERGLVVRDYKSGNSSPDEDLQLGTYKIAMKKMFGADIQHGEYFMTKKVRSAVKVDLSDWTEERVAERFKAMDLGVKAEEFPPKPSTDNCRFCSVAMSCAFFSW